MKRTIKEYRKINNLSQQELSDVSGVSIRTIQRIEKNLSLGSPFTLKSLCKALNIDVSNLDIEILEEEVIEEDPQHTENTPLSKLNFINLSALSIIVFPFLNLFFSILLYLKFKKQGINQAVALKILSFQILWTLITSVFVFLIAGILTLYFEVLSTGRFPFYVVVYYLCVVVNVYFIIDTAVKLNKSQKILHFTPNIL